MKKLVSVIVAVAMILALSMTAFAEVDFTIPKENVRHVSYDEIRPGIVVGGSQANINTPAVATGTTVALFWGWVALAEDVVSFSYSINNGEVVTPDGAVVEAEDAVIAAAAAVEGATTASRFSVNVPVTEGTQLIKIFANFEDGSSEVFWIAELTVGEATEYDPGEDSGEDSDEDEDIVDDDDNTDDEDVDNTETGDVSMILVVVAAALVLTVVAKKKIFA